MLLLNGFLTLKLQSAIQILCFVSLRLMVLFLQKLHKASIIECTLEDTSIETVECFFVVKKGGRLRLVIDARRANCHFQEPSHTALPTGDSLGRIEVEEGETLHVGLADLKDAFYHLGMPEEWRPFFGLRSVKAGLVGITSIGHVEVSPDTVL